MARTVAREIRLLGPNQTPCIDGIGISLDFDCHTQDLNQETEETEPYPEDSGLEQAQIKDRLIEVANKEGLWVGGSRRSRCQVWFQFADLRIELEPRMPNNKFFSVYFNPSQATEAELAQVFHILLYVLGPERFYDLYKSGKITKIHLAFDLDMDINVVYFDATHFQSSAIADSLKNFCQSDQFTIAGSFLNDFRGPHLAATYIGSKKTDRIAIYDKGLKPSRKKRYPDQCEPQTTRLRSKLNEIRGNLVRIEFRLFPRNDTATLEAIDIIHSRVRQLLRRLSVYKLTERDRVKPGSQLHLFIMACRWMGFPAAIRAVKSNSPSRAKYIKKQFTILPLDRKEMLSRLDKLLRNFASHFDRLPINSEISSADKRSYKPYKPSTPDTSSV